MDSQPINVRTLVHHIEHLVLYSLLLWQLVLGVRWWIKTYFKYWKAPQEKPIYINGGGIQAPNVVGDNTTTSVKKDLGPIEVGVNKKVMVGKVDTTSVKMDEVVKGKVKTQKEKLKKLRGK